ncbi:restriction endonuclease subunit S [Bacillus cereus]|uniref:restriction endonuclease subunit S n=1 Tax=Bacillus cereus group TaxID=86661 RepID=UPI0022E6E1BB|nr:MULTISPECIES: restriction endonuclease subunit S [Bacillus cereus group]MCU4991472.1 restriction endonuclease subunit S [Bacillus cereus]MDA2665979.1 restriction endonuclease subunit S [Bacillus cereus group sp. Bc032]MDA2676701.1 restriction endonuclease subunit S [Bacillus cereus group sp. Bc031]MDA2682155.1 restriction endonuclease subunit S [Bacillus cereus group sp. Bc029]MDA2687686.1 restriction endonuclease subunit S [Bacillus cereus group sp. Bc030]
MKNKLVPLTEVCEFKGGSQPPKSEWIKEVKDGYIRMLQIRDFTQKNVDPEFVKVKKGMNIAKEDDILIARYGASIGKIVTGLSGTYNVALIKAIPNLEVLSKKYLYYFLKSNIFQNFLLNVGSRAAQAGFNKEDLKSLNIYLPLLKEQDKIVLLLDKTVELITKRQAQIEALDELTQSVFLEMFGDPIENSKGWKTGFLKNNTIKIGSGATPRGGNKSYKDEGISLIRSMNVYNNSFQEKNLAFIDEEQAEKLNNVAVLPNDVLLNITGASVARSCIVPNRVLPARVNQHVSILRVDENKLDCTFLNYLLTTDSFQKFLIKVATNNGATREAITKRQIEELKIIVPPLELQRKFNENIKFIENQKKNIKKSLKKFDELYSSILQKAFKGELFQEQA